MLWILLLLMISAGSLFADTATNDIPVLIFYTWIDYIDEEVVDEFEKKFNCQVHPIYYNSVDERDEKLFLNKGKGFDVIMFDGSDIAEYAAKGWLAPLGAKHIPNYTYLNPHWVNAWPETAAFAIPYLWGTAGIIYRSDLIKENITSWKQLYHPAEYLKGRIMMLDTHRSGIGYGLKALGYSCNSEDPEQLQDVEALLLAQKPYVQTYGCINVDESSGFFCGDTWIGQTWNGDALLLQQLNPAIQYVVPEEGSEIWVDYLTVSAYSRHPKLAKAFVNYLQEPEVNARCALATEQASPNLESRNFLPQEFLDNKIIYPTDKELERCEFQRSVSPKTQGLMIEIWSKVIR